MIPGVFAAGAVRGGEPAPGGDPYWDNVVALLHFDGDLEDEKGGVWERDPSLTDFETNDPLFGSASLRSLGKGLGASRSNPIDDPAAEFTIEGFVKVLSLLPPASNGDVCTALYGQSYNFAFGEFGLWFRHSPDPAVVLDLRGGTPGLTVSGEFVVELGQRYHFAHTYDGITHRVFVDGVMVIESAQTFGWKNTGQPFRLGAIYLPAYSAARHGADALFDELRITKGVARYTSNFTPPNAPFPAS